MEKHLKQCTLTLSKLGIIFIFLSGCTDNIYSKINEIVDSYYNERRNERNCASSLLELYQIKISYNNFKPNHQEYLTSIENDLKIEQSVQNYLAKIEQKTDHLDDFKKFSKEMMELHPFFFNNCLKHIKDNCESKKDEKYLECQENHSRLFYLDYLTLSWPFQKLQKEKQDQFTEELKKLKSIR